MEDNYQNENEEKEKEKQYNDDIENEDEEEELIKEEKIPKKRKNEEDKNIREPDKKRKRRRKNECSGNVYICGCGKNYKSYPALSTHIKLKHNGKAPKGTIANLIKNGKRRGRPRKNFLIIEEEKFNKRENKHTKNLYDELNNLLNYNNCPSDYHNQGLQKFIMIYNFFDLLKNKHEIENLDANNKSTFEEKEEIYNILDLFNDDMINNSNGYKKLYICCKEMINKEIEKIEKKEKITCDQAFIYYLFYISKFVKKEFCKINLMVLKHFRDLINILGWNLISEYKSLYDEDTTKDFCSIKEPLKLPLIVGDFCNNYMKEVMKDLDIYFGIIIISHFSFWLYENGLTFIKLNLPNIFNEEEKIINEKYNENK